jgi:hypothetical protein
MCGSKKVAIMRPLHHVVIVYTSRKSDHFEVDGKARTHPVIGDYSGRSEKNVIFVTINHDGRYDNENELLQHQLAKLQTDMYRDYE